MGRAGEIEFGAQLQEFLKRTFEQPGGKGNTLSFISMLPGLLLWGGFGLWSYTRTTASTSGVADTPNGQPTSHVVGQLQQSGVDVNFEGSLQSDGEWLANWGTLSPEACDRDQTELPQ